MYNTSQCSRGIPNKSDSEQKQDNFYYSSPKAATDMGVSSSESHDLTAFYEMLSASFGVLSQNTGFYPSLDRIIETTLGPLNLGPRGGAYKATTIRPPRHAVGHPVPPLQGQGPLRPYISGNRGEIASFSTPAWFAITKTSRVSNFSCPPNPTRGTLLPGWRMSPPSLPTSTITIRWWRLTIAGNRANEWKMCVESPRLPGCGLPWKRNGGRLQSNQGCVLVSRM